MTYLESIRVLMRFFLDDVEAALKNGQRVECHTQAGTEDVGSENGYVRNRLDGSAQLTITIQKRVGTEKEA